MKRSHLLLISGLSLLISPAIAIIDTNDNGLSDLWEKQHNDDELFPENFDPQADPDQDGWTNAQESAAGTDPFDPNPPGGYLRPEILHTPAVIGEENGQPVIITPEAVTVSWATLVGKQYTLQLSPDLSENWITIDQPLFGDGDIHEFNFTITGAADKRFWRVAVEDTDTDDDTLTDAEESALGSDPQRVDSDGDGLSDNIEVSLGTGLLARDTDGDGVIDGDESRLATDPLAASDLDSDGMPDDWERFMSDALLDIFPDPGHWGSRYTHLIAGNLDPALSYTSEGMTAGEIHTVVSNTDDEFAEDPFQIEWQEKDERVSGTHDPENETQAYHGSSWSSSTAWSRNLIETSRDGDSTMFDRGTLISRLESLAWAPAKIALDGVTPVFSRHPIPFEAESVGVMLPHAHSHFLTFEVSNSTTGVIGRKKVSRVRLASRKPLKEGASASWVRTEYLGSSSNPIDPERIQDTEIVEMKIETGGMFSEWITVDAETPASASPNDGNSITLVPLNLITDMNNDGQINASDNPLRDAAMAVGATDIIKDKGTEYIFHNDTLSNGLWDKEDADPDRPATATEDDDAERIIIEPGITDGQVWLEHPAIAGLSFYKTRECKAADKVSLSSSGRFIVSAGNPFPDKLFMRADGSLSYPSADPQFEGDLILKIKPGANGQETEVARMKLTVVETLGAKKYFLAARDYISENNTNLFARKEKAQSASPNVSKRVITMLHERAKMKSVDSFHRTTKLFGIDAVNTEFPTYHVVVNGNFCFSSDGRFLSDRPEINSMTDRCHGRLITEGNVQLSSSVGGDHAFQSANADFIGWDGSEVQIRTGIAPVTGFTEAMGGFGSNLGAAYTHPWFGIADAGVQKVVFSITPFTLGKNGSGAAAEFRDRLRNSGCPQLPGGAPGEIQCIYGDGSSSLGLSYDIAGSGLKTRLRGRKHTPSTNAIIPQSGDYYINTYVLFQTTKPR